VQGLGALLMFNQVDVYISTGARESVRWSWVASTVACGKQPRVAAIRAALTSLDAPLVNRTFDTTK